MNAIEFAQGQQDCKKGIPHESGHTVSYDAGYSAQYGLEQVRTAESELNGFK